MAKQIKAIQCPQCGSAQQTNIKEDHYKCGSCGAEYFLDNDDINVNVRYQTEPTRQPVDSNKGAIVSTIVISSIIAIVILFNVISWISSPAKNHSTYSATGSTKIVKKKTIKERIRVKILSTKGNTVLFYITDRNYDRAESAEKDGYYAVFYDYEKDKIIKEERLENEIKLGADFEYSHLPAISKDFIIVNKRKIFEVNFNELTFKDVSVELLAKHNEFSSGIASAKFIYEPRGEGFVLISNMGKEFYFVPSFDKLYKKDDFYNEASSGMRGVHPNAINKTYYTFTGTSHDYPESDIMLLKIVYKYNNGGPEDKDMNPSWRKQYPYSGIIYDNTPFKKILIDKDAARVLSYEDITPGRTYFSASVLYEEKDDKNILIAFKPTIAPDQKTQLQLLNLETKEPVWTLALENGVGNNIAVKTAKYYVLPISYSKLLKIDCDGQNLKYIDLEKEREY